MVFIIEFEREEDGRWLAEVPSLPGVMAYGVDRDEAVARVQALALRVIAERLEHREAPPEVRRAIADRYLVAYGANPGLGAEFSGWVDLASWPDNESN